MKKDNLLTEAEILLKIAQTLEPFDLEGKGRILAAVSAELGFYSEARWALGIAHSERLRKEDRVLKRTARRKARKEKAGGVQ